jgi:hypothetical protein
VDILDDQHLEQLFLLDRIIGAVYYRSLANFSPVLMEQVPLQQFMQYGTPHSFRIVRHQLNETFGEQWTGRGSRVNWPARSPNLSPLHFWLWGYLGALVYSVQRYYSKELICLSTDSSETRNFRQSALLCLTKS